MRKMRLFQHDAYISIDFADGVSEVFRLADESTPRAKSTKMLGKIEEGQTQAYHYLRKNQKCGK